VYAVIVAGGRQYKVSPGDVIEVNRLPYEVGQTIDFNHVLMIGDGAETQFGHPILPDAAVRAKVADNFRSRKIIVFKYKSKVRYRRKNTHRQDLTRLVIKDIVTGAMAVEAEAVEAAPAPAETEPIATSEPVPEITPAIEVEPEVETESDTESEVAAPVASPG